LLQTANDLGGVRAKLLNCDTMFSEWNNDAFSDDEFLIVKIYLALQPMSLVEHNDRGSLT